MGLLPLPPSLNLQLGVGKELAFWSLKERLDYKLLFSYLGKLFHPLNFWPFFYGCKEIMALLCGNSQDSVRRGLIVTTIYESSPPRPPPCISTVVVILHTLSSKLIVMFKIAVVIPVLKMGWLTF